MRVEVHFFGNFRYMSKRSEQTIELRLNANIRELLDYLVEKYTKMAAILSKEKIKESHVLIIHGEKPVHNYNTILKEGDKLYLFIMLAGG